MDPLGCRWNSSRRSDAFTRATVAPVGWLLLGRRLMDSGDSASGTPGGPSFGYRPSGVSGLEVRGGSLVASFASVGVIRGFRSSSWLAHPADY